MKSARATWRQAGRSKYGARRTEVDGITFHSAKEARRYGELKLLEKAGEIADLLLQQDFPLWVHTGLAQAAPVTIGKYVADFTYTELGYRPMLDRHVVEDVKGVKTPLYRWKKKHVEAQYGIYIREV